MLRPLLALLLAGLAQPLLAQSFPKLTGRVVDEAQLLNADWRGKAAQSITNAVALFAAAKAGTATGG